MTKVFESSLRLAHGGAIDQRVIVKVTEPLDIRWQGTPIVDLVDWIMTQQANPGQDSELGQ